jgi:hypothetical protein
MRGPGTQIEGLLYGEDGQVVYARLLPRVGAGVGWPPGALAATMTRARRAPKHVARSEVPDVP